MLRFLYFLFFFFSLALQKGWKGALVSLLYLRIVPSSRMAERGLGQGKQGLTTGQKLREDSRREDDIESQLLVCESSD